MRVTTGALSVTRRTRPGVLNWYRIPRFRGLALDHSWISSTCQPFRQFGSSRSSKHTMLQPLRAFSLLEASIPTVALCCPCRRCLDESRTSRQRTWLKSSSPTESDHFQCGGCNKQKLQRDEARRRELLAHAIVRDNRFCRRKGYGCVSGKCVPKCMNIDTRDTYIGMRRSFKNGIPNDGVTMPPWHSIALCSCLSRLGSSSTFILSQPLELAYLRGES